MFFGLVATGFISLSSFSTSANEINKVKVEKDTFGCCTVHNASWTQALTLCDNGYGVDLCKRALALYNIAY